MSAYDNGPYSVIRYGRDEMTHHEHPIASGATVEPGMLVERVVENGEIHVQPHSTDGAIGDNAYVAIEARGRGMDAQHGEYSDGADSYVRYVDVSGGGLNVLLAAGENASITDKLASNGDGTFRVRLDDGTEDGAEFLEVVSAVDNSGGSDPVFVPGEVV